MTARTADVAAQRLTVAAMGSDATILVRGGPPGLLDRGRRRLAELEARWSRFRPDAELGRLARRPGRWVDLSPETLALLALLRDAADRTGGLVDPRVATALSAAGYDRPAAGWAATGQSVGPFQPRPRADPAVPRAAHPVRAPLPPLDEVLHLRPGAARLATPTPLDVGCCGKGAAADLVATELVAAGAAGALVDVGGDVAVAGAPPDDRGWGVAVVDPDGSELALLALAAGGVATSSTRRRRWIGADGALAHHLIDPRTARPATTDVAQVTVVAGTCAWAEVLATAVAVAGTARAPGLLAGAPAIVVAADGRRTDHGGVGRWLR
jgi:thiamine biosynthesis lipoprotein